MGVVVDVEDDTGDGEGNRVRKRSWVGEAQERGAGFSVLGRGPAETAEYGGALGSLR